MKFVRHKIGELCHNVTDGEHGTVINDENGDFYLLSNKNIKNGKIVYDGNDRKINNDSYNKINKRTKLEYDDVVIATVGTIGRTAIIKDEILKYDFQRSVGIYKVNKSVLLAEFLHYYFQLPYVQKRLINLSTGAVQKCLFISDLKNIDIDLPKDFYYQKKIAKVLSDLDAKIELNNKINAELEAMAKLIYDYWFVQFDFPNENGNPYKSFGGKMVYNDNLKREIPAGWEVKELGDLLFQVSDSLEPDEYPNLKYLPIDKLPTKKLYYDQYEKRSEANSSLIRFLEDDILLGAMRVYFHRVCNAAEDGISRSTLMVLRAKVNYHKNFGLFTLNREEAIEYATKNSTGTSIPYAKWNSNMEKYKICVADRETLFNDFNKIVDPILEKFKVLTGENRKLIELRDWLLPMLMNGQVKVN